MRNRQSLGAAFSPQPSAETGRKRELYKLEETEGEKRVFIISEEHPTAPDHFPWLFPTLRNQSRPGSARV